MKITDARIGMRVATKNGYPMTITGIFTFLGDLGQPEKGILYLDFEGNPGDVWEEDVAGVEPVTDESR